MENDVIEFLKQSNYIEGVMDGLDASVEAWKYIIKQSRLTEKNILRTHALLMQGQLLQEDAKGAYRKQQVWVGGREGEFWEELPKLVREWIKTANKQVIFFHVSRMLNKKSMEGIIELHHVAFETIHPFLDGNGRIGRILLNWQRVRVGLPILIIKESERKQYYKWFE